MYKVYKLLNIESELLKSRIDYYVKKQTIHQDKHKELNKKTIAEGDAIIEYFGNKLAELEFQEDNWTQQNQLYCILKIYLKYGVLRPSEMIDCAITEKDGEGNYINVSTKQIVIHHHKNDRKGKKVIQIENDELVECLIKGSGKYLVLNQSGILYQSSSAFTKTFEKEFNDYKPYCLRKAISSAYIAEGDIEKIKKLEHNQGHDLKTILNNYNVYTKSS
jgi:hypothetical protein